MDWDWYRYYKVTYGLRVDCRPSIMGVAGDELWLNTGATRVYC
jgi:hypothetical protein